MDIGRGLLKGVQRGAEGYSSALQEQSKRKYEDQKANVLYGRQQSLEALRNTNQMARDKAQQGYEQKNIEARGIESRRGMQTQAELAATAKSKERQMLKDETKAEDMLILEEKINSGMIDPEVGATILAMRDRGVPMKELIPEPGKKLTPTQLKALSEIAIELNPDDPEEEFIKLQKQFGATTGGSLGKQTAKEVEARRLAEEQNTLVDETAQELEGMTKAELINYRNKYGSKMSKYPDVIKLIKDKIEKAPEPQKGLLSDPGRIAIPGRRIETGA